MVLLFLLSVGVLIVHHTVPRTELVDFRDKKWRFQAIATGAGTTASSQLTERGIEADFEVVDGAVTSVCAISFESNDENPVVDLSWMDKVTLTAYVEGDNEGFFRLFLRNRIPGVYKSQDVVSRQYNEVAFRLGREKTKLNFNVDHFHVPTWWAETYGKRFEDSLPSFKAVDMIEVATGSSIKSADLHLVIEEIKLEGYWISPLVLYRTLLTTWMVLAGGIMFQRLMVIKSELKKSNEREKRLRKINASLNEKATELSNLAHHDSLTGIMNRLGVLQYEDLASEAVRQGNPVSLIVIDVDNFKSINDKRGHVYGDEILASIGALLSEKWTGIELFARWGGEEFVVICFDKNEQQSAEFANELRMEIASELEVTCSFGVYEIKKEEPFSESVDRADQAMYIAKKRGKNRVVTYREIRRADRKPTEKPISGQRKVNA